MAFYHQTTFFKSLKKKIAFIVVYIVMIILIPFYEKHFELPCVWNVQYK